MTITYADIPKPISAGLIVLDPLRGTPSWIFHGCDAGCPSLPWTTRRFTRTNRQGSSRGFRIGTQQVLAGVSHYPHARRRLRGRTQVRVTRRNRSGIWYGRHVPILRMDGSMIFKIFKAFPPDRESAVVELNVWHDGMVDVPAEIYREDGERMIAIFGRGGGAAWVYPLDEWLEALRKAAGALGE